MANRRPYIEDLEKSIGHQEPRNVWPREVIFGIPPFPDLTLCGETCFSAAANATGRSIVPDPCVLSPLPLPLLPFFPPLALTRRAIKNVNCLCGNADFQFRANSCVQAECEESSDLGGVAQLQQRCAVHILFVTGQPTVTVPFHPSNSNADFSGSALITNAPTPPASQPARKSNNSARTMAIVASLAAVAFLIGVAVLLMWVRKRRRHADRRRLPEQFLDSQEHILRDTSRPKVPGMVNAESSRANQWQTALFADGDLKANPVADSDNLQRTDPPVVAVEHVVLPRAEPGLREGAPDQADGETMTLRLRRVEAQLENLLTMGLPEGSPPSYTG
ncbi:CFEM domain-containing protein [Mycena venus]|uniref:CFEM domain-containing protein n=1 Tax=Mycena venus TaxID=2733690 RepID=A0A8H7DAW7_9AGAR|nr:CFEM domain-containing protein [Mycena venus]